MIRKEFFERVNKLFYSIINNIDKRDKKMREYQVIVPEFTSSTQVKSKRISKHEYVNYYPFFNNLDKFSEYHELIRFIENNFDINQEKRDKLIHEFLRITLNICREENCIKKIEPFIEYLYNDLMENPFEYYIKECIIGFDMEDQIYQISDNLTIRKANSFDFECRDLGEYSNEHQLYSFQFPPVILEYVYKSNFYPKSFKDYSKPKELEIELFFIDVALLLFRSAPYFRVKTHYQVKSIFSRESLSIRYFPRKTSKKYLINRDNIVDIRRIFQLFQTEEIRNNFLSSKRKNSFIGVALNMYQNSYLYAVNDAHRITSLISCLEALLSESAQELKRRLSQRVALILRIIGFNPLIVYEDINLAYNIRNKYSHGDIVNLREKLKDKNDFIKKIINYTRLCFLISLQINNIKGKKQLLKLIDQALLDEQSYKNLAKLIEKKCVIFKD